MMTSIMEGETPPINRDGISMLSGLAGWSWKLSYMMVAIVSD